MGIIWRLLNECLGELKWMAIVVGFLEVMLDRWLFNLSRREFPVSPTYCLEQREQVMRYIKLEERQLQFLSMGNNLLYEELRNVEDIEMELQVEHFLERQGAEEVVGKVSKVFRGGRM